MTDKTNRKVPPIRFVAPEFCDIYKPLLVDDFALNSSPLLLHYGKCAVIGRTACDVDTNRMYLESVRLVGLNWYIDIYIYIGNIKNTIVANTKFPWEQSISMPGRIV